MVEIKKPVLFGILGGSSLFSFYFTILTAFNGIDSAVEQFYSMWYFIIPLTIGFGIQMGLYIYLRESIKSKTTLSGSATKTLGASGGISSTSMVACCAHHIADVLPILGFSTAALFLSKYQTFLMTVGILSNLIGINLMLKIIQTNKLFYGNSVFWEVMKFDMNKILNYNIFISIFISIIFLINLWW